MEDFTHSWVDGKALLALLNHARKGKPRIRIRSEAALNIESALKGLEAWGVPRFIRGEILMAGPRDRTLKNSMITLVAVVYRAIERL